MFSIFVSYAIIKMTITDRIEREKFYPGLGLEPGPLALHSSALTTELSRTRIDP